MNKFQITPLNCGLLRNYPVTFYIIHTRHWAAVSDGVPISSRPFLLFGSNPERLFHWKESIERHRQSKTEQVRCIRDYSWNKTYAACFRYLQVITRLHVPAVCNTLRWWFVAELFNLKKINILQIFRRLQTRHEYHHSEQRFWIGASRWVDVCYNALVKSSHSTTRLNESARGGWNNTKSVDGNFLVQLYLHSETFLSLWNVHCAQFIFKNCMHLYNPLY